MNLASKSIKILLFVFNLVFSLCGLAVLICGVLTYLNLKNSSSEIQTYGLLAIGIVIIGGITFVIAFFGCFGAIRENRCMLITFGTIISIILIIQIALSIYLFITLNKVDRTEVEQGFENSLNKYYQDRPSQTFVDLVQSGMKCCGIDGPNDYKIIFNGTEKYPSSCCPLENGSTHESCESSKVYHEGCHDSLFDKLILGGKLLGGIILGIAAVELIGIIFTIFLVYTIKNDRRQAMRA